MTCFFGESVTNHRETNACIKIHFHTLLGKKTFPVCVSYLIKNATFLILQL